MDFYIFSKNDGGSGCKYKTKDEFLKEVSMMIDDCVRHGGTYFDIEVTADASCYLECDEEE